jgi:hypothetical protein
MLACTTTCTIGACSLTRPFVSQSGRWEWPEAPRTRTFGAALPTPHVEREICTKQPLIIWKGESKGMCHNACMIVSPVTSPLQPNASKGLALQEKPWEKVGRETKPKIIASPSSYDEFAPAWTQAHARKMGSYAEHRVEATEHGGAARLWHTATPTKRQSMELPSAHEATCEAEVVQKKKMLHQWSGS